MNPLKYPVAFNSPRPRGALLKPRTKTAKLAPIVIYNRPAA